MNYLSQSWLLDRRHALRAFGTCISPFLECMVPLRAELCARQRGGDEARRGMINE